VRRLHDKTNVRLMAPMSTEHVAGNRILTNVVTIERCKIPLVIAAFSLVACR
jgi:hypothetical protein